MASNEITIRPLRTQDDFRQCVALQYEIWGDEFGECAPPSLLLATQEVGGVAAGAFDGEGRLQGFVFGLSGLRQGRPAHWSDMLGVRAGVRNRGLGLRLKAYQRARLLELGIDVAYWSYDPLEAKNAHININRLGARPIEYVPDMYGEATGSSLHAGLGTDRFIVEWQLSDPRVEAALAGSPPPVPPGAGAAPVVNSEPSGGTPEPREPEPTDDPRVRVEVPEDIQSLKRASLARARAWRAGTRRAFTHYLARGYRVTAFLREREARRCFYLLERE